MTISCASGGSSNIGRSNDASVAEGETPVVANTYEVVPTGVHDFFEDFTQILEPSPGEPFFRQGANYKSSPVAILDIANRKINVC